MHRSANDDYITKEVSHKSEIFTYTLKYI